MKSRRKLIAITASILLTASVASPASAATVTKTGSKTCATGQHPATSAQVSVLQGSGTYRQQHTWTSSNASGWREVASFTWHRTLGYKSGNYTVIGEPSFVSFSVGCASDPA